MNQIGKSGRFKSSLTCVAARFIARIKADNGGNQRDKSRSYAILKRAGGKERYYADLHESSTGEQEYSWQPTQWWSMYKQDLARYKKYRRNFPVPVIFLTEQGLWALLHYRIASALYRSNIARVVKIPLLVLTLITQKFVEVVTGISLPYQAAIGPGLYIGHFGNIILGTDVVMGHTCNIGQGVTIGVSGRGKRRGVPKIGNRVYIAANAVVVGKISVGDDAVIAANSLVTADVDAHTTVMGVPAQVVNTHGSEAYLDPDCAS